MARVCETVSADLSSRGYATVLSRLKVLHVFPCCLQTGDSSSALYIMAEPNGEEQLRQLLAAHPAAKAVYDAQMREKDEIIMRLRYVNACIMMLERKMLNHERCRPTAFLPLPRSFMS